MQFSLSCVVVAIFCLMAGALPGADATFCAKNMVTSKVDICAPKPPVVYRSDNSANCPKGCKAVKGMKLANKFFVDDVTSLKPCCGLKKINSPFLAASTRRMLNGGAESKGAETKNLTAEYSTLSDSELRLANVDFAKATGQNLLATQERTLCFTDASFEWQTFCKTCYHSKGQCCSDSCRGGDACYQVNEGTVQVIAHVLKHRDFKFCGAF